jgi:transposase
MSTRFACTVCDGYAADPKPRGGAPESLSPERNNVILDEESQRDEICALKAEARSYRTELEAS